MEDIGLMDAVAMTVDKFTSRCLGSCTAEINDNALTFAIEHYRGLEKQLYFDKDVADCIHMARRLTTKVNLVAEEDKLFQAIEELKLLLREWSETKESLRMVSDDLRKITAAAGLAKTKRKGNWKNKEEEAEA
jgi:hypothetical protein